ncbi:hypothetical protein U1Q18_007398 [Sarracenia purpurea var. burkii]
MVRRMMNAKDDAAALGMAIELESAKHRCRALIDRILSLPPKPSHSCNRTLLRLAHSEISFLSRFSNSNPNPTATSLSSNVGHLEAVVHILEQPFINGVSRVCKSIALSPLVRKSQKANSVHVDIVCTLNGNPVWFLISARNPKYISWNGSCRNKSLRTRLEQLLDAAAHSSPSTKPASIILFFSNGLDQSIRGKIEDEFGASEFLIEFPDFDFDFSEELEGDWIYVLETSYRTACVLQIKVDHSRNPIPKTECGTKDTLFGDVITREDLLSFPASLCCLISRMKPHPLDVKFAEFLPQRDLSGEADLINFDTTALIAFISGISNGCTEKLLAQSESKLRQRFKSNYEFVIAQVMSEIKNPIHVEMNGLLSGKKGMLCESVCSKFKELVSMCGGPNEKSRAGHLLKCLMVVPDNPSERMLSLPTTRKLTLENKIIFGTGDHWRAPTLTANMSFVRAVSQSGMSLFTIEHRPLALTGD